MQVDPRFIDALVQEWQRGTDPANVALQARSLEAFRDRFPAEQLRRLSGEQLLMELHGRESHDTLAFWLEYKDDDTFKSRTFGSISGGSALKFGIYQRKEDGGWYVPGEGPGRKVSLGEATTLAERQRDQMMAARDVVLALPEDPDARPYERLQEEIEKVAPDLCQFAFFHKYLFMQAPGALDDFHAPAHQNHHLLHAGLTPPSGGGLYRAARYFVSLLRACRRHAELSMAQMTSAMIRINGGPVRYWRVGTGAGGDQWVPMRDGRFVAIGWSEVGNLREVTANLEGKQAKEAIRKALQQIDLAKIPQQIGRDTNQVWSFFQRMSEGDRVLACDGQKVLGIGRIAGPYRFERDNQTFAHRRPVEWLAVDGYRAPDSTGLQTTVHELTGAYPAVLAAVAHLRRTSPGVVFPVETAQAPDTANTKQLPPLEGITATVANELERKGQVLLFGPPGTGKTFHAWSVARELAARRTHRKTWGALGAADQSAMVGDGPAEAQRIWTCTFHPAFGYEEFVEGLRPVATGGQLVFDIRAGLFRQVAAAAERAPNDLFFLIIDEMNRGDVPRIFGELLTVLEKDKRGILPVRLPHSQLQFLVPKNVRLIATMNTADRSIAIIDTALRRRFSAIELLPQPELLQTRVAGIPLNALLAVLNERLMKHLGRDARHLQVGHSFFMPGGIAIRELSELRDVLRYELFPLLQEYCYDTPEALADILGDRLYNKETRLLQAEVFDPAGDVALRAAFESWQLVVEDEEDPEEAVPQTEAPVV